MILDVPAIPADQIDDLLKTVAKPTALPLEVMEELRYHSLASNLDLVVTTAQLPLNLGVSGLIRHGVDQWIGQRLRTTRQVGDMTSELFAARKLLDILASIEVGIEGPGDGTEGLSARRTEYALRRMDAWAPLRPEP